MNVKKVLTHSYESYIMHSNEYERGDKMKLDPAKLAAELTRQRLTQKQLAEKAGISRVTVSSIKCGKTCTDAIGNAIAEALRVDIKELLEVNPG